MDAMTPFARRLWELRDAAELTQSQLAERAGLHRQGIAKLELGEREPTWATMQALARALGVSCEAFQVEEKPAEVESYATALRDMFRKAIERHIPTGEWGRLREIEQLEREQWTAFMQRFSRQRP
jgi:transcriptional regulator with XRE-family HTH domain